MLEKHLFLAREAAPVTEKKHLELRQRLNPSVFRPSYFRWRFSLFLLFSGKMEVCVLEY